MKLFTILLTILLNSSICFAYDFSYSISDPSASTADEYIVSKSNVEIIDEGTFVYWKQDVGATLLEKSEPGTVIYRFDFQKPIAQGNFFTRITTFNWSYSKGHSFIYASKDGVDWIKLAEATPPPDNGGYNIQSFNNALPSEFIGVQQVWIKVELNSYGTNASYGGAMTNTAQHLRYEKAKDNTTFRLEVDFDSGTNIDPDTNPVPTEDLVLDLETRGTDLTLSWTAVPGATSYMLYFALPDYKGDPDPATIGAVDLGNITTISAPLWNGADLYIAVAGMNGTVPGMISTIEQVTIFTGETVFPETGTVWAKILDPDGSSTVEFVGTDNNGKPGLPLTEVRMPSDDGQFTLKLDDQGRVQSASRGPVAISFTFQSDDSVNFEYRFDGELVVSDTTASLLGLTHSLTKSLDICTQYTTREAYEQAVKESPEIVELKKDISALVFFLNVIRARLFNTEFYKFEAVKKIRDNIRYLAWVIAQTQAHKMAEWDQLCADQPNDDDPPSDEPANSCRLLYDESLDDDDDYIIWHGDEDNGYRCRYDSHGDFRLSNETHYKDGEKDGLEKAYYVGTLTHEIQWLNGEQHGVSRSYHSNGNVWYEHPMFHGLQDGIEKIYYQSGVLEKEIPWYQGDDFVDGIYKSYWENGNLKYETGHDENGKETGVRKQYYESGQLHNIHNVVEYKFQGEGKTYYESGQLMEDEYYVDGDLHGTCKYYREDGTLKDCRIYDHDSYEGSCMP